MTPWLDDGDVKLYHGDALERLREMPSESVQCIVTSPPFWGLRDYGTGSWSGGDPDCDHVKQSIPQGRDSSSSLRAGRRLPENPSPMGQRCTEIPFGLTCGKCGAQRVDAQIGLEEAPDEWCAKLVAVMREARRVLRSDGCCWLECGDTYNSGTSAVRKPSKGANHGGWENGGEHGDQRVNDAGSKPKDLVGAPWLLAFALRADGWYLRSDTIWARPNPMPESVTDRPTKSHSYVFLLTKSARYFFDADAIREPHVDDWHKRASTWHNGTNRGQIEGHHNPTGDAVPFSNPPNPAGRNARSVWSIATEPTPFAHFATFPQALVERCVKAGTSEHGACSECGAPWRRITERAERPTVARGVVRVPDQHGSRLVGQAYQDWLDANPVQTLGWEPSCTCFAAELEHETPPPVPCVVLDPFMGSGTTALVARRLNRHAIGIELNRSYLEIASKRLEQLSLFAEPTTRENHA